MLSSEILKKILKFSSETIKQLVRHILDSEIELAYLILSLSKFTLFFFLQRILLIWKSSSCQFFERANAANVSMIVINAEWRGENLLEKPQRVSGCNARTVR